MTPRCRVPCARDYRRGERIKMIWAVTMPTWGLSMEEGTVVGWLVDEGMRTAMGAELVEIETTKIANSLERNRRVCFDGSW